MALRLFHLYKLIGDDIYKYAGDFQVSNIEPIPIIRQLGFMPESFTVPRIWVTDSIFSLKESTLLSSLFALLEDLKSF